MFPNRRRVSLTPIVPNEPPNHDGVVSNANVLVHNQLLCNEAFGTNTHTSNFVAVHWDWKNCKVVPVWVEGPILLFCYVSGHGTINSIQTDHGRWRSENHMTVRHDVGLLHVLGRSEWHMDEKSTSSKRFTEFRIFTSRVNVDGVVNEGIGYSRHDDAPGARSLVCHIDENWAPNVH
jgi:hypothetical protein